MSRKPKPTKRPDPDKPLTINQMITLFREVLEGPAQSNGVCEP
jgi:hypothetical protein